MKNKNSGEYLVAVDLEGIHGVVGEPFLGLTASFDYSTACANAVLEINSLVSALFDNGATKVVVWDNHGNGKNINFNLVDKRAIRADVTGNRRRMDFAQNYNFEKIFFVGYHSMEGTLNGVLAHSYSSVDIQYIKVNGTEVGEYEIDSWIAGNFDIAPAFASSDNVALNQIAKVHPNIVTVATKIATGRNSADFLPPQRVLQDIYNGGAKAVGATVCPIKLEGTVNVEVRFTRTEYAKKVLDKVLANGDATVCYGNDAHVLLFEAKNVNVIPDLLWAI